MKKKIRQFDVITIFPQMVEPYFKESILGKAMKKNLVKYRAHDLRRWSRDKHRHVDDRPYGGGPGMVMTVEPFERAVKAVKKRGAKTRVILLSPRGKIFCQRDVMRLLKYDQLILLCGRYEGVDERVAKFVADESLSIGEFVMTGGELGAMVIADAVSRHIPGVLGKEASLETESYAKSGYIEYPQYTRPENYKGKKVPTILLSGDHAKIQKWREKSV